MGQKLVIGVCGPPSAGKTTTAQLLRWKLRDVCNMSREVPREYARHYMEKYDDITDINQQLLVFDGQTKSENQIKKVYDITISDSPRFLAYIYAKNLFDYTDPHSRATLVRLYELALEAINDYDALYLLTPAIEVERDGLRIQDENDALNIFNDIKNFTDTHCKTLVKMIPEHDKNDLLSTVDYIIKDLINKNLIPCQK